MPIEVIICRTKWISVSNVVVIARAKASRKNSHS
jgi:hypothetical protein